MRLLTYLRKPKIVFINEAKVERLDADAIFEDVGSIPFMWTAMSGLLYVLDGEDGNSSFQVAFYKNSRQLDNSQCYIRLEIVDNFEFAAGVSHAIILKYYECKSNIFEKDLDDFIRGRISPDGKIIYIHNLDTRHHSMTPKQYEFALKKTVNSVYKYLRKYIK